MLFAESLANDFLRAASVRIALVVEEYLTVTVDALHMVVTKVSHDEGRLLLCSNGRINTTNMSP